MCNSASNLTKSFDYLKVDSQNAFTLFISYQYEILKQVVFFDTRTFFFFLKKKTSLSSFICLAYTSLFIIVPQVCNEICTICKSAI
jgi:hypothetical protein